MLLATLGYWGIGLGTSLLLAFHFRLGAEGLWWGLAAGLAAVAGALALRFHWISRRAGGNAPMGLPGNA
jgi:MATE family multidrug resistance protein